MVIMQARKMAIVPKDTTIAPRNVIALVQRKNKVKVRRKTVGG